MVRHELVQELSDNFQIYIQIYINSSQNIVESDATAEGGTLRHVLPRQLGMLSVLLATASYKELPVG